MSAALRSARSTDSPASEPAAVVANDPAPAAPARGTRVPFSLLWVIPGAATALLALSLGLAGQRWESDSRALLVREVEARLVLEARHLALASTGALLDPYPELTLQPILRDLLKSRPDLESALVVDRGGIVRGHPESGRLGQRETPRAGLTPAATRVTLAAGESLDQDAERLVARSPVKLPTGETIGGAVVVMRRSYLESAIETARRQRTTVTTILLVLGSAAMLVSIALLLRPVSALRRGMERIGRGELDVPIVLRTRNEFGMLATTLNTMATQVRDAQRRAVEQERLTREMELARGLQRSLLPLGRHAAGDCLLLGVQTAATEVGGDLFDIVPLEDGRIGFAIADVAGKGLGGCLIMTMLSALLRGLRDQHASPATLLAAIDRAVTPSLPRARFVTMTYGILDAATGRARIAFAGHLPAAVYRAAVDTVEWVHGKASPIGAVRKGDRPLPAECSVELARGDLLIQFTDGYVEAPSPSDEQFELPRIEAVIRSAGSRGADAVIAALDAAVAQWTAGAPARDDQTILVVGRGGATVADGVRTERERIDPLELFERARRAGNGLTLEGGLEELPRIRGWLGELEPEAAGDPRAARLLESALYEVCANVIEHGHRGGPARVDLWRLPEGPKPGPRVEWFLVRDHGMPFDPGSLAAADFDDPLVRRRGRGLGVPMIRQIMSEVRYAGGTREGNLTLLRFDESRFQQVASGGVR